MTAASQKTKLAAEWRAACLLYPTYAALARQFVIDLPACNDLQTGVQAPPPESIEQARQWLVDVDERIQVHQLRQFLQTTTLTTQEALQTILIHHLRKEKKSASDRDKIDFLLVQFFAHLVPSELDDTDVQLDYVAEVLKPALGSVELTLPAWLDPLEQLMQSARRCCHLSELLHSGILDQGRKLKVQCGEKYFEGPAMVAFTRFSFIMRRVFFHLMHEALNAILDGLRELERRGLTTVDCRRAEFCAEEPIARLRMICQSWRVMFHAEYSSGQPLRMLVDLRSAVDDAVAQSGAGGSAATGASKPSRAAAASACSVSQADGKFPASRPTAPEFEVLSDSQDWSVNQSSPESSGSGDKNAG